MVISDIILYQNYQVIGYSYAKIWTPTFFIQFYAIKVCALIIVPCGLIKSENRLSIIAQSNNDHYSPWGLTFLQFRSFY